MSMTDYQEARVLKHELGIEAMTFPTAFYVGLMSVAAEGGTVTEPSGNGYARVPITPPTCWNAPVTGEPTSVTNAVQIQFATPTGNWGEQTLAGLFDAASGGNLLRIATLDTPISPAAGDNPYFAIGELEFTLR